MLWYLPEIECDFLAIYGKDVDLLSAEPDTGSLTGPRFLNLALHLPNYAGALSARAAADIAAGGTEAQSRASLMLDPDLEVS